MTLQFYKKEHQRLLDILSKTDPKEGNDYFQVLHCVRELDEVALRCIDVSERIHYYEEDVRRDANDAKANNVVPIPVKTEEPKTEPTDEHPVEQPFPEPESEAEEPKPLTLAEVKEAFTAAAKSGIKVAEIINDTGYARLSEVPAELYAALMQALERKKAGED